MYGDCNEFRKYYREKVRTIGLFRVIDEYKAVQTVLALDNCIELFCIDEINIVEEVIHEYFAELVMNNIGTLC